MERARHRKTKSASGIEGIWPISKQKTVPRLSSDSHSYIDGSNRDEMFMLELGQSNLGRGTGIPMKKLLAEEMSKDVESKKRSPSVIARLMGLEGLPSPRHAYRQQKKFPENYQQKNVSTNKQRSSQHYDSQSERRSPIDQPEFKDVYEDLEASHVVNRQYSSRWGEHSILTKPEMELIRQKFMDAKRLSTVENFQGSKELNDTLEMLDSNKDLLLKFLGQSDSLFVQHLHDLQADPGNSFGSHIAVLKPSNSEKFESKAKAWRSERDTSNKPRDASHLKREDGLLLEPHSRHRVRSSTGIQVEETKDKNIIPTRIVVLKPNLGKIQNAGTSLLSPDLSHSYKTGSKKIKEYSNVGSAEMVSWRRKDSSHNAGLSMSTSKEARQIAREITMRMRDGYDENAGAKSTVYSGYVGGYVGDESSYDANESDSDSESDVFIFASRRSFDVSSMYRYPSSYSGESPVNTEAKKRLSERWKMTHKYQDLEMMSRGNTLGEMLALPNRETGHCQSNVKMSPGRASKEFGNNGTATLDVPLGISSRDGWKDEICRNSSRSRSLPPPTGGRGRSHRSLNHNKLAEDKGLMHSNSVRRSRSKVERGNLSHGENYSANDSQSRIKSSRSCQHIFANEMDSSSGANIEILLEPNTKDLSSEQQPIFPMAEKADNYEVPVVDVMMISDPDSTNMSSKSSEILPEQSLSTIASNKVADHNQEGSCLQELQKELPDQGCPHLQCPGADPDSSASSKEAHHPSPVSVLEVPCGEDTPSSECFERVSAELHELRMQLKLLKLESGTYAETSALVPIEEEEGQPSPVVSEGDLLAADNWRTCYALDVLIESGLEESYFHILRTPWHSSNSPLDPNLFDKLEKKYSHDETTGLRWERRLLFDEINSSVMEIFQKRVNLCPWVTPKVSGSNLQWQGVQDDLERLINQDYISGDGELDRDMLRSECRAEIEILGNEIERLLIDEMITEVICN
ncbi:hypothetical protein SASPL_111630 [Salvia splendens]|uniref:DUF4378 domain-containing protein n=2 Tax=Salvia splendens TaxID=180675 RepID=A0A8X8Y775_SALSN|nr:uncharacterized protein LOC121798977 isoform X1 [Salvia splendens]XP_042054200.1 uncharacterized protein LOC121798977 isoform X1 [Salvia splendens]KAG6427386.1 hypothetical protein SASPL_111630 [Salvia splendens]